MTKEKHFFRHGHGRQMAITIGLLLLAGVLMLWGWNTLAVDLFGAPAARFKHALALEAALGGLWLAARTIGAASRPAEGSA